MMNDLLVADPRIEPPDDGWDWPQAVYGECEGCGAVIRDNRVMLDDALVCSECAEMEDVDDEDDERSA